jgi:hypothetical protein
MIKNMTIRRFNDIKKRAASKPATAETDMIQDLLQLLDIEHRVIPDCKCFVEKGMYFDAELGVHICRVCEKVELIV